MTSRWSTDYLQPLAVGLGRVVTEAAAAPTLETMPGCIGPGLHCQPLRAAIAPSGAGQPGIMHRRDARSQRELRATNL
jgi:hypothetical protein